MNQQQIDWPSAKVVRVNALAQESVALRCSVAANPLGQNTILQIEWFKDGRKLSQPSSHISAATSSNGGGGGSSKQQATISRSTSRLLIERANHLHMPQAAAAAASTTSGRGGGVGGAGNQLAPGSKLTGSSWLSIGAPLNKSDSGNYTCQFKLIPAPPTSGSGGVQTTHPNQSPARNEVVRITSGQANQTVQVNVIEGKLSSGECSVSSENASVERRRRIQFCWPSKQVRCAHVDRRPLSRAGGGGIPVMQTCRRAPVDLAMAGHVDE